MTDPSSIVKTELSSSTDGRGIKVARTATAGTTLHTVSSVTGDNNYDEIWLWARNSHSADVLLTIEFGGVTDPDDLIEVSIPYNQGLFLVVPGLVLQNGLTVGAFAATINVITIFGYSNEITA